VSQPRFEAGSSCKQVSEALPLWLLCSVANICRGKNASNLSANGLQDVKLIPVFKFRDCTMAQDV